jgi:CRISPR-associated Csx2 family protein
MNTLISFLGKGDRQTGYAAARYRFDDGFEFESRYFGAAAFARLLRRGAEVPVRWIIVGTTTSRWSELVQAVAQLSPDASSRSAEWANLMQDESSDDAPVSHERLREFESLALRELGLPVNLVTVGLDGEEIFEALYRLLVQPTNITLDVTHAFRTMPLNALLALGALRWLRGVRIDEILYGVFDRPFSDGARPAHSLKTASRLARFTPAIAQLHLFDDVGQISELFRESDPTLTDSLNEVQRLESILQFDAAGHSRDQSIARLQSVKGGVVVQAVAQEVTAALNELNQGTGSVGLINRAERALARGDFMRALALSREALDLKLKEIPPLPLSPKKQKARDNQLKQIKGLAAGRIKADKFESAKLLQQHASRRGAPVLDSLSAPEALSRLLNARNSVIHSGIAKGSGSNTLRDREGLTALLEWSFKFYDFIK